MSYYESLQKYYQNGCVLHPGETPQWGEVGYKKYMQKQIFDMGIKSGDIIAVEEKWHNGAINQYEGIVLHINDDRIWMLIKGKKVWKDRSNQKDVVVEYITKIEKTKDARPDFDIYEADPNYKVIKENDMEEFLYSLDVKRTESFQKRISSKFPQIDIQKVFVLWMQFDFCWPYSNGKVEKAEINIVNKNDGTIPLPKFKLKHVYPNNTYYSTCGVQYTDKEEDGILLFFDSFEELAEIRLISCAWTVELDEKKMQFLQMIYPKFTKGEGNVYNLSCRCTDMGLYEDSLRHHSVFSGALEKDYDKAFVYISDTKGESIMEIMNADNIAEEIVLDAVLCLNSNNLVQVIQKLSDKKQEVAEVLIKSKEIKPKGYAWPF